MKKVLAEMEKYEPMLNQEEDLINNFNIDKKIDANIYLKSKDVQIKNNEKQKESVRQKTYMR